MYRSNRNTNIHPPGIPRAFDSLTCPGGREFDISGCCLGGEFDTRWEGWGGEFDRLASISCYTLRGFFHNTCNGSSKGQADESQE